MNILLLYPKYPETFWSFKNALKFISKKATEPPLGLLTVAAMLPADFNKKLIDLNVDKLRDSDIAWADYVFISAMSVQKHSAEDAIRRCQRLGKKVVAGGPLFTSDPAVFSYVEHLVLNEAELTLPLFLQDLKAGNPRRLYRTDEFPGLLHTPLPAWELIDFKKYAVMDLQFSRGCPYNCDFCDIVQLYGRRVRTKSATQMTAELDALYDIGWRNSVFFVDDNFIGNRRKLKGEILPVIIEWMRRREYPFTFSTEVSVNLADDPKLMEMMIAAGFDSVFVGIETPNAASLAECNKTQNVNRDLLKSVDIIQKQGLMVKGGFIVGFDSDDSAIFDNIIDFIQNGKIVNAMVGLLNAPKGTKLYRRLKSEGRLLKIPSGDNTDLSINFIPKMDYNSLIQGYKRIIRGIYSPRQYYRRVIEYLKTYKPLPKRALNFHPKLLIPLFKSLMFIGVAGKERRLFWKLIFWTLFRNPKLLPHALTFAVMGYHFRKVYDCVI